MGIDNENIEILHDHYKESFIQIRDREKIRDRLFLLVTLLLGLLYLEVHFPSVIKEMFTEVSGLGLKFNPSKVPIYIATSITWTILFIMSIKYCQLCITVDRQYDYLHLLENKISGFIGDSDLYSREGKSYKTKYPIFSWWAWIFYTILFPVLIIFVQILVLKIEYKHDFYSFNKTFDCLMAGGIALSFILYRGAGLLKKCIKIINKSGK